MGNNYVNLVEHTSLLNELAVLCRLRRRLVLWLHGVEWGEGLVMCLKLFLLPVYTNYSL